MDDLVFSREEGELMVVDALQRQYIDPALTHAGLRRFTIHQLRHTYATLLIKAGVPLPYISKQLGHSSIKITVDTYGHLVPCETLLGQTGWIRRQLPENPQTRRKQRKIVR
jgi:integrase